MSRTSLIKQTEHIKQHLFLIFLLLSKDFGFKNLPVLDGDMLVGIITSDKRDAVEVSKRNNVLVEDIMDKDVPIIDQFAKIQDAIDEMIEYDKKVLVIVQKKDPTRFIGLIDVNDISDMSDT